MSHYARWPVSFLALPACIFHPVSLPARSFRRWRRRICLRVPAGRCRSLPRRRAFIILFFRRQNRFDCDGVEYVSVCPLAAVVLRHAGVHLSFCFSAGKIVSTVMAWNMSPCARWPVSFFTSPACIYHSVSPPARSFRRWRRRICLRVPAGHWRSSPRQRAFFVLYLRRQDRFDCDGVELVSVCPLAAVVLRHAGVHLLFCFSAGKIVSTCDGVEYVSLCPLASVVLSLAGVHFSFCISAGKIVSPVAAENMFPCARWRLSFLATPACIYHSVSPPARSSRRWRRGISLRVPAGRCRSSPRRRAFIILFLRRQDRFDL